MSSGKRRDPFPAYCFKVELYGVGNGVGFFKSVNGISYETEATSYHEGGVPYAHQLVGVTKWANLVFKRGFMPGFDLINWVNAWTLNSLCKPMIVNGCILQYNTKLDPMCSWTFERAWPQKWEMSEYDASKNEVAIETLTLAHHGLRFVPIKSD